MNITQLGLAGLLSAVLWTVIGFVGLRRLGEGLFSSDPLPYLPVRAADCPELRTLVSEAATRAGISPPNFLWVLPDTSLRAFMGFAGDDKIRSSTGLAIGSALALLLPDGELTTAVAVEFAALKVRKNLIAVEISHRIRALAAALCLAYQRGGILTLPARLVPLVVFSVYARWLSRVALHLLREEASLCDAFALRDLGRRDVCRIAVKVSVLRRALTMMDDEQPSLLNRLNSRFYKSLGKEAFQHRDLNWFVAAADQLMEYRDVLWTRIEAAKDEFLIDPTWQDLRERIRRLGWEPEIVVESLFLDAVQGLRRPWGRALSSGFVHEYLPTFLMAKLAVANHPNMAQKGTIAFLCGRPDCPCFGSAEVLASDRGIRSQAAAIIEWKRIVSTTPEGSNLVIELARGETAILPCHGRDALADIQRLIAFFIRNWRRIGRTRAQEKIDALTLELFGALLILVGVGSGLVSRFAIGHTLTTRLLAYAIASVCFCAGPSLYLRGKRHLARTADYLLLSDERAPILYLRPFTADAVGGRTTDVPFIVPRVITEEQQIAQVFNRIGPLITLGKPDEVLPHLGAARLYTDSRPWQEEVEELIDRAVLVVIRPGNTPGIEWEVKTAFLRKAPERIIVLCTWRNQDTYAPFRQMMESILPKPLPDYPNWAWHRRRGTLTGIIQFSSDWQATFLPFGRKVFKGGSMLQPMEKILQGLIATFQADRRRT